MANSARGADIGPRSGPGPSDYRTDNDHDGWNPGRDASDAASWPSSGLGPDGWRRADATLRDRIVLRLLEDRILDASGIRVQVDEHVVTLSGKVRHASDLRLAEMLTREVCPDAEIRNRLYGPEPG